MSRGGLPISARRWRVAIVAAAALVLVLMLFQDLLLELLGVGAMNLVFTLAPVVFGLGCWVAAGNSFTFGLTWAVPLALINAAAIFILPLPAAVFVSMSVIGAVALLLFSSRASTAWYRLVTRALER